MKAILITAILGLSGTTGVFWYSMRDVNETCSSYSVDRHHSQILEAQELETMLREGSVDAVLARLQRNRDSAIVQLGQMRRHIDTASWQMDRNQYTIDRLDAAIEKEVEYRRVNGETNGKLSDQVRSVLAAYDE